MRAISPDEYDAAARRRPECCPLYALGDGRSGRDLLAALAADASRTLPDLAADPAGRGFLAALPARLAALAARLAGAAAAAGPARPSDGGGAERCGGGGGRNDSDGMATDDPGSEASAAMAWCAAAAAAAAAEAAAASESAERISVMRLVDPE